MSLLNRARCIREVRYCACAPRVQLQGSVSMTMGQCILCRCEARKLLSASELLQLAASYGSKGDELRRQGYPVSASTWLFEANRVKREAERARQREQTESAHG